MQQSSFFVRTVRPNRATIQEPPRTTLLLDPPRVEFYNYPSTKISLAKVVLKNQSRFPKKISITQPSKHYFEVKYAQKEIPGREQIEIFVGFNPQREKGNMEDEFIIRIEGQGTQLHVPIYCQYRTELSTKFSSSKQLLPSKELDLRPASKEPLKLNLKTRMSRINIRNPSISRGILQQAQAIYIRETVVEQFQIRFKRISEYVREKYVKNEVYLGEIQLSSSKELSIKEYTSVIEKADLQRLFEQVRGRNQVQYCEEGPSVKLFDNAALSWDPTRNTPTLTFQWGLRKLHEEVRKYVVSLRFEKIQNSLRIYQEYQQKQTRQNKRLKVEQYLEYLNCRLDDNSFFIDYQLEFDKDTLKGTHLPTTNDSRFIDYQFQITQRIGFDNWLPMNVITHHHQELYQLDDIDLPLNFVYMPPGPTQGRKGAPQELTFKQPPLECIQQIQALNQLVQDWGQQQKRSAIQKKENRLYFQCENVLGIEQDQLLSSDQDWLSLSPLSHERWPWRI